MVSSQPSCGREDYDLVTSGTIFIASTEGGNIAIASCSNAWGFLRMTDEDPDGFTYFARRRFGWADSPWRPYEQQGRALAGLRRKLGTAI